MEGGNGVRQRRTELRIRRNGEVSLSRARTWLSPVRGRSARRRKASFARDP